jgi:WD40 repeat protein
VSVFQAGGGSRVTRVRFNASGSKLGATDMAGALSLWRFDLSEEEHAGPFFKYRVHSKRALELCWINEGSVLATGGTSRAGGKRRDVALWDVLMPSPCVASWATHPGGAHSLAYSPRHQLLVSGGKEGDLCVFDLRQRVLLRTISRAHALNIKCLALAPDESLLASGSTDGAVRVWDLGGAAVLAEREHWADVHEKRTFMKPTTGFFSRPISTYGAMDVAFANGRLLSCGADGRLLSRPIFSASTRS